MKNCLHVQCAVGTFMFVCFGNKKKIRRISIITENPHMLPVKEVLSIVEVNDGINVKNYLIITRETNGIRQNTEKYEKKQKITTTTAAASAAA